MNGSGDLRLGFQQVDTQVGCTPACKEGFSTLFKTCAKEGGKYYFSTLTRTQTHIYTPMFKSGHSHLENKTNTFPLTDGIRGNGNIDAECGVFSYEVRLPDTTTEDSKTSGISSHLTTVPSKVIASLVGLALVFSLF